MPLLVLLDDNMSRRPTEKIPAHIYDARSLQSFTPEDFIAAWYEHLEDRATTTVKGYDVTIRSLIAWLAENGIDRPQRSDLIHYRDYLAEPHTSRKTGRTTIFTADTQARYFRGAKMFFAFLADRGLYPDIAKDIRIPRTQPQIHKRDYLKREDILRILETTDGNAETEMRNYCMILMIVLCGLRVNELRLANVGDIEEKGNEVRLYIQGKGHTAKDAYKKIPPELWHPLKIYIAKRRAPADAPLFSTARNNARPGGQRISETGISRIIKTVLINAGYNSKRITAHSLRHTSITFDRLAGATLEEAQRHARHTDITITQRYDHSLEQTEAQDEARIAAYLFGNDPEDDNNAQD